MGSNLDVDLFFMQSLFPSTFLQINQIKSSLGSLLDLRHFETYFLHSNEHFYYRFFSMGPILTFISNFEFQTGLNFRFFKNLHRDVFKRFLSLSLVGF